MTLEPIGDIADVSITKKTELTWETATDWDNAVSETGVVHESVANTDHGDESTVKMGYSSSSPYKQTNLIHYWPCHEDTGSTLYDQSGNNNDGSGSGGGTYNDTGILGTTSVDSEGSEYWDVSIPSNQATFTLALWWNFQSHQSYGRIYDVVPSTAGSPGWDLEFNQSSNDIYIHDSNNNSSTISVSSDTWYWLFLRSNGSDYDLFVYKTDGTQQGSTGMTDTRGTSTQNYTTRMARGDGNNCNAKHSDVRLYDTNLSNSERDTLVNVATGESSLTTATKSYGSATKPDLQNLSYSLNSQTINLDVIGSPGTASEEIVTQTLSGATSYTLSWANSHTDFRLKPRFDTGDITTTPTFGRGELVG